jgi:hypothetical protein
MSAERMSAERLAADRVLEDRWLDLDADPPGVVVRRREPVRLAVVTAAVVVGALGGAALASLSRPSLPPAPSPTVAVITLDTVVLDPVPSAVLALRVDNLGQARQLVRDVHVSGGDVADAVVAVGQELPAGGGVDARVVVPLRCDVTPAPGADRISAMVRIAAADAGGGVVPGAGGSATSHQPATGTVDVRAVGVGRAAQLGGMCAAADAVLPGGWRSPAHVAAQRLDGDELDLAVTGLPADATRIVWIDADGILLPQSRLDPGIRAGTARLRVPPPAPGCRDTGVRPVVPTGLQLHLEGPGGLRSAYAPVGAVVAQWLMDAYGRSCPELPAGPVAPAPVLLAGDG